MVSALTIDIGTASVRTGIVDSTGRLRHLHQCGLSVTTPQPGEVELDAVEIGRLVLSLARHTLAEGGPCEVLGITNQRATTVVFDPITGVPVGPALGWQDLRTVLDCLTFQGDALRLAPNQSATKVRWLVRQSGRRAEELRFATLETWVTWLLTEGDVFVTDRSNAGVNGMVTPGVDAWDARAISLLDLDPVMLPRIVDTMDHHGRASALPGAPIITALIGDQPASLFGQSQIRAGAKITFGTGAMLDMIRAGGAPTSLLRYPSGCFPVVLRSHEGRVVWGLEAIDLSAGSCLEWLRDDLGLVRDVAESEALAKSVDSSEGVLFVPALSGLGTPQWDFGARGGFYGLTRGSSAAHLVRAVLEGIAQRGADLVDAAELESGTTLHELRVDGGMVANGLFTQRLADYAGRPVAVSSEREATARGAGLMALVSAGHLTLDDVEQLWHPSHVMEPQLSDVQRSSDRDRWSETLGRAARAIPDFSDVTF